MKLRLLLFIIALLSVMAWPVWAGECQLQLAPGQVRQGDCFVARLAGVGQACQPQVSWAGRKIPMFWDGAEWRAYLPLSPEVAPGSKDVVVRWADGAGPQSAKAALTALPQKFGVQYLKLAAKQEALYTAPGVEREYRLIRGALGRFSPQAFWQDEFIVPVKGRKSTAYGLRRFRNGVKQGIHKGLDYGAPLGTPVRAANNGVVTLVAEDFKMHGKTVIIDHGQGVCTIYLHLSKILVKPGQQVAKGETIAKVGATGVATGPHLHYALYVADTSVNPAWWESQAR